MLAELEVDLGRWLADTAAGTKTKQPRGTAGAGRKTFMGVRRIDAERALELMQLGQEYVYVDVRTEDEFAEGHVPRARNVPLMRRGQHGLGFVMNEQFVSAMDTLFEKDDKLILGCRKGGRSAKAAEILSNLGYTNLFDMRGGFVGETDPFGTITFPGWTTRGFPTTTEAHASQLYRHPSPGAPSAGTPSSGTPSSGTPSSGAAASGAAASGTPSSGTPSPSVVAGVKTR